MNQAAMLRVAGEIPAQFSRRLERLHPTATPVLRDGIREVTMESGVDDDISAALFELMAELEDKKVSFDCYFGASLYFQEGVPTPIAECMGGLRCSRGGQSSYFVSGGIPCTAVGELPVRDVPEISGVFLSWADLKFVEDAISAGRPGAALQRLDLLAGRHVQPLA
jgi:hypothetical protein